MELIFAPVSQEDHSRLDTRRCRRLKGSEDGVLGRDWQGTADGWEARGMGGRPLQPRGCGISWGEAVSRPWEGQWELEDVAAAVPFCWTDADLNCRAGEGTLFSPPTLASIRSHPCLLCVESIWKGTGRWRCGVSVTISWSNSQIEGFGLRKNRQRTGQLAESISQWRYVFAIKSIRKVSGALGRQVRRHFSQGFVCFYASREQKHLKWVIHYFFQEWSCNK